MSDVVIQLGGLVVRCSSAEEARDLLLHLTGAQRLAVVERGRVRRTELPAAQPKTLEDVARRHATPPVRIAEAAESVALPAPIPDEPAWAPKRAPKPRPFRPIREHLRGEEPATLSAVLVGVVAPEPPAAYLKGYEPPPSPVMYEVPKRKAAVPGARRGRPPKHHDVRGADLDEGGEERAPVLKISDRIVRAFAKDEHYPLPRLAGELFGEQTGRALTKVKLALEQLVAQRRLLRTGAGSWQPLEQDGDESDDDQAEDGDDADATPFDTADERPAALDDAILSELGLG